MRNWIIRLVVPLVVLGLWEMLAQIIDRPLLLPTVGSVVEVLIHPFDNIIKTGSLVDNAVVSMLRVLFGFSFAAAIAIPLGFMIGYSRVARAAVNPLIESLRPIPPLAWVPLALSWFGVLTVSELLGMRHVGFPFGHLYIAMMFIIFLGSFFPILLNTIAGVESVPKIFIESALTLGAKRKDVLLKVIAPASVPNIMTGLRIGMGIGWMCLVAAEMLPGSTAGLGYLIFYGYDLARIDVIIAGMVVIGLIGGGLSYILLLIGRRSSMWRQ